MELLKDGGGGERRHIRDGLNGPGGQRGESEGDDSAEWSGVSTPARGDLLFCSHAGRSKAKRCGFTGRQRLPPPQRLLREDPRRSEAEQRDAGEEAAGQRAAGAAQPRVPPAPPAITPAAHTMPPVTAISCLVLVIWVLLRMKRASSLNFLNKSTEEGAQVRPLITRRYSPRIRSAVF